MTFYTKRQTQLAPYRVLQNSRSIFTGCELTKYMSQFFKDTVPVSASIEPNASEYIHIYICRFEGGVTHLFGIIFLQTLIVDTRPQELLGCTS